MGGIWVEAREGGLIKFENDVDRLNGLLGLGNEVLRISVINPGVTYEGQKRPLHLIYSEDSLYSEESQTKVEVELQPRPRVDRQPFINRIVKISCENVRDLQLEHGNLSYTELIAVDVRDRQMEGIKFQLGGGSYGSMIYLLCKSFTVEASVIGRC